MKDIFGGKAMKLIVNADDFGYTESINYGILEAHIQGILTSTTLMANMPGFDHAVSLHEEYPSLGIGVHLVLTCGKPLLDTHKHIVNDEGIFYHTSEYQEVNDPKMTAEWQAEVMAEWDAQIQKIIAAGIKPTHLDSHHHTHMRFPLTQEVVTQLAEKYNLPVRVDTNYFQPKQGIDYVDFFERRFDEVGEAYMTTEMKEAYYQDVIKILNQYDTVEIMTHPGYLSTAVMTGSTLNTARMIEVDELIDSTLANYIFDHDDIELITYAEL